MAKSSGDPEIWSLYKQKRYEVKKLLRSAEAEYWQKLFNEATDSNEFWKLTNQVLRKYKVKNIGPICDHNEEIITHDLEKTEYFNDFFVNVSKDVTKQLDPLNLSSLNTFITRVTPTRDKTDMSWELVKKQTD